MAPNDHLITNGWGKPIHMVVRHTIRKARRGNFPVFQVSLGRETFYLATDNAVGPQWLGIALFPCCNTSSASAAMRSTISPVPHHTEANPCVKRTRRAIAALDSREAQAFLESVVPCDPMAAPIAAAECANILSAYMVEAWETIYVPGTRKKVLHLGGDPHGQ